MPSFSEYDQYKTILILSPSLASSQDSKVLYRDEHIKCKVGILAIIRMGETEVEWVAVLGTEPRSPEA